MQDAMKKVFLLTFLLSFTFTVKAQSFLSLDSCRALALANNKDLLISNEKISAAHYQRKAAFTNYLPNFSATGAYMRNQKEFSLLNNDQKAALSGLGTNLAGPIQQAATEIATAHPDLAPLISSLSGKLGAVLPALDQAGNSLVDALRTDTRNIYAGAITLTQPLYMGGKIRAYNNWFNLTQQNNKVCRRVGSRTTSRRYAGSNHEYGPSLLASHFTG
jgi:hypothetical protein